MKSKNEPTFQWVGLIVRDSHGENTTIISSSGDQDEGKAMKAVAFQLAEQKIRNKSEGIIEVQEFHESLEDKADEKDQGRNTWTENVFFMEFTTGIRG